MVRQSFGNLRRRKEEPKVGNHAEGLGELLKDPMAQLANDEPRSHEDDSEKAMKVIPRRSPTELRDKREYVME